jgi:O-antigen/teichoic acid export membrane protein
LEDETAESAALGTALLLFLTCGILAAGLLAIAGPAFLPRLFRAGGLESALRTAILFFSAQVLFDVITEGVESCLEGIQRVDLSRGVDAVRRTVVAAATAGAALGGLGLSGVAAASAIASASGPLVAGVIILALRHNFHTGASVARALLRASLSVALLRPLGVLERTMDRLVVGVALGPASVTIVEIAAQVANGAAAILSASAYAVVPASSWLHARSDRAGLRELLDRGTRYSMLITLPVIVGVAIVIVPALHLWVGMTYSDAELPAVLALMTVAQVAPLQVGSELLVGTGHTMDVLRAAAAAIIVNLGGSIILVRLMGIPGTFVATLIAGVVLTGLLARSFLGEVGETVANFARHVVARSVAPSLVLGLAAGVVVALRLSDVSTLLVAIIGGGALCVASTLFHSLEPSELTELRTLALHR